jgi:predicted enzyme related to lactoylglutathione lyase
MSSAPPPRREGDAAVDFDASVLHWDITVEGDTDEFRYSTTRNPDGEGELAGIMDATSFLPADTDATIATLTRSGGSVVMAAEDTPYGRLATVADPAGAIFTLRTAPE